MSARSPRGSLSGASSEDVAADFLDSLRDLQINNRYEISNLTIIAKENTEHAQAISEVLQGHIKTTAPSRKLPALYVLDSIVKNVGTPYTVYLGRNLYQTFMDSYTLVDATTRRNMEGMLKTWKEPVPGAMDPRPVFPPETVRPIENALIKARTAALGNRQLPPRSTPTPPQARFNGQFYPPPHGYPQQPSQPQYPGPFGNQQPTPQHNTPYQAPTSQQPQHFPYASPAQQPSGDLEPLKRDVSTLLSRTQAEFAADIYNSNLQQRLKALIDLQTVLNTQQLPAEALQAIRAQVSQLSRGVPSTPQLTHRTPAISTPQWQPPQTSSYQPTPLQSTPFLRPPSAQPQMPYSAPPPGTVPPVAPPPPLGPAQLSTLQAMFANGQKPSTPQMRDVAPVLRNASHGQLNSVQKSVAPTPQINSADLLASLAKSGLLPPAPTPAVPSASTAASVLTPQPPPAATQATPGLNLNLLAALAKGASANSSATNTPPLPLALPSNLAAAATRGIERVKVPMSLSTLKSPQYIPSLVRQLYDDQPNQCSTCGRRFSATEAGRTAKQRHLDWHFRTSMRLADGSLARGAHRSWFLDELPWIDLKDFDASTATSTSNTLAGSTTATDGRGTKSKGSEEASAVRRPEEKYVRAPPGMIATKCSVCQEDLKASLRAEIDDWVFMNAARYRGKIVHATCLAEIQGVAVQHQQQQQQQQAMQGGSLAAVLGGGGGQTQRERSATPDSLLGKRKAEAVILGGQYQLGTRVRRE